MAQREGGKHANNGLVIPPGVKALRCSGSGVSLQNAEHHWDWCKSVVHKPGVGVTFKSQILFKNGKSLRKNRAGELPKSWKCAIKRKIVKDHSPGIGM